jgi:hypothetical protein
MEVWRAINKSSTDFINSSIDFNTTLVYTAHALITASYLVITTQGDWFCLMGLPDAGSLSNAYK